MPYLYHSIAHESIGRTRICSRFAGATNTPIACTFMGIELFGIEPGIYLGIACVVAYLFSGHTGIYTSQVVGTPKHLLYLRDKGKTLK